MGQSARDGGGRGWAGGEDISTALPCLMPHHCQPQPCEYCPGPKGQRLGICPSMASPRTWPHMNLPGFRRVWHLAGGFWEERTAVRCFL